MGASISVFPKAGQFDLRRIRERLDAIPGVVRDAANPNRVSLSTNAGHSPEVRPLNPMSEDALEHRSPLIDIAPSEVCISINWSDNERGDARAFLEWLLGAFPCYTVDGDGHRYEDATATLDWINTWLPRG